MPQPTGSHLGPYEILSPLGAGGMGEVYRARDSRLKRDVALKLLPAEFANDPERMMRFQREAEVLAALNHPNIAAIYGIEEGALVMELVEGATLSGPLPIETALVYARQIVEALEAAHEKGITHRDLKPANIMITPAGMVKVLDFGLAKAADEPAAASNPANSPTLTMSATRAGMILGTAAYMSPEQAAGKPVDRRSDIWSFGVVLWEMLSGETLFHGETIAHTLADVLRAEIDLNKLPSDTPPAIRDLLRRCLIRDAKNRMRDIGEARIAIDNPGKAPEPAKAPRRLPWIAAAVFAVAALVLTFVLYRRPAEEPRMLKFSVPLPEKASASTPTLLAVSPDGRRVAFIAVVGGQTELWLRDLDSLESRRLSGTEGALHPFWSTDSRNIAFFAGGKLKKISVAGGPALSLCDAAAGASSGGSWSRNDVIVFSNFAGGGLLRVPAAGGSPTPLTAPDQASGEISHRFPWFLPDGLHFLYTSNNNEVEKNAVFVTDLDSKTRRLVMNLSSNVVFGPPGYLLFVRDRTLMAQPFDAGKREISGDAVPIAEQIDLSGGSARGQFSISQNGILAYTSGGAGDKAQLTWFDRSGRVNGTVGTPGGIKWVAISPDGATVAVDLVDPQTRSCDVWLHDLLRGTASRFTLDSKENLFRFPVWSPDGSHIAYLSNRDGTTKLFQKATSGVAQEEILDDSRRRADDWSRDGRYLIEETPGSATPKTGSDIWVLPLFGDRKPFPFLQTEFAERNAKLSPNGPWLAYNSDKTKRHEVYVRTFPTPGGEWQVSTNGGTTPIWSRDGKELFYISADQKLMAVEVKSGAKFEAGLPKPLFATRLPNLGSYDVSKDGRFLIPTLIEQSTSVPMTVVVNWTMGLKR